jgi:chromosome segregation ATPase
MTMIRKTLKMVTALAVVVGGVGFLALGTDLPSYAATVFQSVRDGVQDQIPIDLQLKRAEQLLEEVDPQIESCKRDVARAEVELEELLGSVQHLEQVVTREQGQLQAGQRRLVQVETVSASLVPAEVASRRRLERSLQRKVDSYRNNLSILKTKRSLIERQQEAVDAARQRLLAVRSQQEELQDMIRSLRTQQQWVEAMAANQRDFRLDDSALSEAKDALEEIQKRLDVKQRMLENEVVYHVDDQVFGEPADRDVVREIVELFDTEASQVVVEQTANVSGR